MSTKARDISLQEYCYELDSTHRARQEYDETCDWLSKKDARIAELEAALAAEKAALEKAEALIETT